MTRSVRVLVRALCDSRHWAAFRDTVTCMSQILRRRQPNPPVVLGQQLADATEAERRRLTETGLGPSPMPKATYDFWRGELSLANPTPLRLDADVADLVRQFQRSDPGRRADMRRAISMDGFYTLLTFSKRQAVYAIRMRRADPVEAGLAAIAVIEADRTDFRDILVALSLLHHAARRLSLDAGGLFAAAAALSEPKTGRLIEGFAARKREDLDLRDAWGYEEVVTDGGLGFIRWGFAKYEPTRDLKSLALDLAALLEADDYQPDEPEVATEIPRYWLGEGASPALEQVLGVMRGGASVSGRMRPGVSAAHASQQLTIFVAELADPAAATRLADVAMTRRRGFSAFAVAEGGLFAMVVARSFVQGVEAHETPESLTRFGPGLSRILEQHAQ